MSLHKSLNRVENNGFVNMSASCFSESTFETIISPAVTNSRTKKCLIRICFVLRWNSGFWASRIAASLSICNVGVAFNWSSSVKILLIQMISLAASLAATTSASVVDMATEDCLWLIQEIGAPEWRHSTPEVERPVLRSPP
jgi:hypothetical protein